MTHNTFKKSLLFIEHSFIAALLAQLVNSLVEADLFAMLFFNVLDAQRPKPLPQLHYTLIVAGGRFIKHILDFLAQCFCFARAVLE